MDDGNARGNAPVGANAWALPEALLWFTTALLLVGGVTTTWMSIAADQDQVALRTLSASVGSLLTAMAGITASYVITRQASSKEVSARYVEFLGTVAMGIAHVYSVLNTVTEMRRSGSYQHEETYQEAVVQGAEELLTQFDGIARVCGPTPSSLAASKSHMDGVKKLFERNSSVAEDAFVALRVRQGGVESIPAKIICPACSTRFTEEIANRAGWTRRARCPHCTAQFNVHRRADLSVYVSQRYAGGPADPSLGAHGGALAGEQEEDVAAEAEADQAPLGADLGLAGKSFTVECPRCGRTINCSPSRASKGGIVRTCLHCMVFLRIDTVAEAVRDAMEPMVAGASVIVARNRMYAVVSCPADSYPLNASFDIEGDPRHFAVCVPHRAILAVSRSDFREWLAENDPHYLELRSGMELRGDARREVLDLIGDRLEEQLEPLRPSVND